MKKYILAGFSTLFLLMTATSHAADDLSLLPSDIQTIMAKPVYSHARWGLIVKDLNSGKILYQYNTNQLMIPASASKTITVAALLSEFGPDYTFKTPVYALGTVDKQGVLDGDLVLVAKGDLVMGGRVNTDNKIEYTNFDHVDANALPGATLTKQDPLSGLRSLAKQVKASGIKVVNGSVSIDVSMFQPITKRENVLNPVMINENLYDVEVTPGLLHQSANIKLRPQLNDTVIINKVTTVEKGKPSSITIDKDETKNQFVIQGQIALNGQTIVNTYPIEDPQAFAKTAFEQALQQQGIIIKNNLVIKQNNNGKDKYAGLKPVAILVSPPLIEYAKLILKVSHNMGANLVPLLLASAHDKKTYDDGMKLLGGFIHDKLGIKKDEISYGDAAGGNENYVTSVAVMKLLEYVYKLPKEQFQQFIYTLPILGVDGSLSIVATQSKAKNHVFAKTGTGIIYNRLFGNFMLTSKALAGFYQMQNQDWAAFFVVVNQGVLNDVMDVLDVNNDLGLIANALYVSGNP